MIIKSQLYMYIYKDYNYSAIIRIPINQPCIMECHGHGFLKHCSFGQLPIAQEVDYRAFLGRFRVTVVGGPTGPAGGGRWAEAQWRKLVTTKTEVFLTTMQHMIIRY